MKRKARSIMPETAAIHLLVVDDNRTFCEAIKERLDE